MSAVPALRAVVTRAARRLNPQLRRDLRRLAGDVGAGQRALWMAGLTGAALLLTWPYYPVLNLDQPPFTYVAVGSVAVLVMAYLAFVIGIRPAAGAEGVRDWAAFVPLAPRIYLRGALGGRMGDLALALALALPLLAAAAAVEGRRLPQLVGGLTVLGLTGATGRAATLALLLWCEHRPNRLIVLTHAAMVGMFVLGSLLWPPLSPLLAFAASTRSPPADPAAWIAAPWPGMLLTHGLLIAAAYGLSWWRVRTLRAARGAEPPAGEAKGRP